MTSTDHSQLKSEISSLISKAGRAIQKAMKEKKYPAGSDEWKFICRQSQHILTYESELHSGELGLATIAHIKKTVLSLIEDLQGLGLSPETAKPKIDSQAINNCLYNLELQEKILKDILGKCKKAENGSEDKVEKLINAKAETVRQTLQSLRREVETCRLLINSEKLDETGFQGLEDEINYMLKETQSIQFLQNQNSRFYFFKKMFRSLWQSDYLEKRKDRLLLGCRMMQKLLGDLPGRQEADLNALARLIKTLTMIAKSIRAKELGLENAINLQAQLNGAAEEMRAVFSSLLAN